MQLRVVARKIPISTALTLLAVLSEGSARIVGAQAADSAALIRNARRAESEYESSIRRFAPTTNSEPRSRPCDEIVGRFCILYESGGDTLPPEPKPVTSARDKAITALQKAHERMPASVPLAFPLVRYLVEAGRTQEAVHAARLFARRSADAATARMLLGYALHADRQTVPAIDAFEGWLQLLPGKERSHVTEPEWLLDRRERSRYGRLTESERAAYERRAWRYADPLYLTPGNEIWADHLARHALTRMLARRRTAPNGDSWGSDLEQLTVRFGPPALTTRSWGPVSLGSEQSYSEHWDPSLRTYVPPVLEDAVSLDAPLDSIWPLDSLTARSGHAPPGVRTMHVLEHQAAVIGNRLVVSGVARADSLWRDSLRAAVFLLDSALEPVGQAEATATVDGDSVVFHGSAELSPSAYMYSAELFQASRRFGARARFRLNRPTAGSELAVSSILLATPFEPGKLPEDRLSDLLHPLTRPVLASGSRVGVYAEVTGAGERRKVQVEIETSRVDRPGAIARAIGWIGGKVGLATPRSPTRLGWSVEYEPGHPNALPVTLDLGSAEPGRYRLTLTVTDPANGESAVATRDLLIIRERN